MHKLPEVIAERFAGFVDSKKGFGILDSGGHFGTVADDAGVGQQGSDFSLIVMSNEFRLKAIKYQAVVFTFF